MCPFPPPPPGAERRAHRRKEVLAQVELARGNAIVVAGIHNLSLGGAYLLHPDEDVRVGESVRVLMTAGGIEAVQEARVIRVSRGAQAGFAVRWIAPTARTFAVLERMLRAESGSVIADAHPL